MRHVVVVGAGQAGASAAAKLRGLGFDGRVTLIGDEPSPPYQRPPLSKGYLLGEMALDRLYLRPDRFYRDNGIELAVGRTVTAIDRAAGRLHVNNQVLPYDRLVLATGASPRPLHVSIGGSQPGVHVVRGLADIERSRPEFQAGRRLLIVGGGYIGLEAAAAATKLGLNVTLIELADRILQRVAAPETSDFFRELHVSRGVEILESTGLERLEGTPGLTAHLSDGSVREIDFVIAGIGVIPNDGLARHAGLACDGGILVDVHGRTSDPAIWAAGDCARFPFRNAVIRLESVQNAVDQAECVAANLLGADIPYAPSPWFWSDQYDVKLQIAGLSTGYDRVAVRAGATPRARSHWYYRGGELIAVDAIDDPRSYMVGRRLISAGKSPPLERISDSQVDLKVFL